MGRRGGCHESTARCSVESLDQGHSCREQNQFCHDFRLILEWTVFEQSWFWRMWDPKCIKNQRPRSSSQSVSIVQHRSAMLCLRFELCIDVDGAATDFPVGGSNFEVYVSPVTAGAPSGAQVVPRWCPGGSWSQGSRDIQSTDSFEALSGNTLQQLANEKLTASWQISLGMIFMAKLTR